MHLCHAADEVKCILMIFGFDWSSHALTLGSSFIKINHLRRHLLSVLPGIYFAIADQFLSPRNNIEMIDLYMHYSIM